MALKGFIIPTSNNIMASVGSIIWMMLSIITVIMFIMPTNNKIQATMGSIIDTKNSIIASISYLSKIKLIKIVSSNQAYKLINCYLVIR